MPSAWGHTRLLETDWRLITQESHCFSCGSVKGGETNDSSQQEKALFSSTFLWHPALYESVGKASDREPYRVRFQPNI